MAMKVTECCLKLLYSAVLIFSFGVIYRKILVPEIYAEENVNTGSYLKILLRRHTRELKDDCDQNINVSNVVGTITVANYSSNYSSNEDCQWLLSTYDENTAISLRINFLYIESDADCKLDHLKIFLGSSTNATSIEPLCGFIEEKLIETNSSTVLLVFHAESFHQHHIFSVDYFADNWKDCDVWLTAPYGLINSPEFPVKYPYSIDCWAHVTAEQNEKILLFFNFLNLQYSENCTLDYIQIFDGPNQSSPLFERICGNSTGFNFESSSNSLLIQFHLNDVINQKGYQATYIAVDNNSTHLQDCEWEVGDNNGTITSLHYQNTYPSFSFCNLWVKAPENERIFIRFDVLQLQTEPNCSYDFLQIRQGSRILETFCGRDTEPQNLTTNKNEVQIQFYSGNTAEVSGFKLRYVFINSSIIDTNEESDKKPKEENLEFTHTPENTTLLIGSSHILHCATNDPDARILWLKDHKLLTDDNSLPNLKILLNNSLWIVSMDHNVSGVYLCVALSLKETITANAVILIKNESDSNYNCRTVFAKTPKNSSFTEGHLAFLECLGTHSDLEISWEKDGLPLKAINNIAIFKSGYIFIHNVEPQQSGLYSCVVKDLETGCINKTSAFLQIDPKMKIEEICGKPRINGSEDDDSELVNARITSGRNAKRGAHPWQVLILFGNNDIFCGGALLNEHWVVTAAHCFTASTKEMNRISIILKFGKYDYAVEEKHEFQMRIFKYSSVILHPAFIKRTLDNDIALIRLPKPVAFNDYILPICLPDRELGEWLLQNEEESTMMKGGVVTGWGHLFYHGQNARYLQEINLPVVDEKICKSSATIEVSRNFFCAGFARANSGDSCQGDSGGPFAILHHGKWYLTGIVSWGLRCDFEGEYGYYVRVPNYVEWIKVIINS